MGTYISFNTGRMYSPEGQLIEAVEVNGPFEMSAFFDDEPEQYILFIDHSRQIAGKVKFTPCTESGVMQAYDNGWYNNVSFKEVLDAIAKALDEMTK